MKKQIQVVTGITLFLAYLGLAPGISNATAPTVPFEDASVRFEQNATDGDVEVVFEVKGGDEGLATLTVVSPNGRTIIDFTAPDASTLGIRQFNFESPEPKDVDSLKKAYPEGVYTFAGATAAGDKYHGESTLNHKLPDTASILRPAAGNVGVQDLEIAWTPVDDLAAYIIELEQDELNVNVTAKLPGSATTFAVPDGFLLPNTEYDLSIGTMTDDGNISFVETTITTAGKE